jgi:lysophospholipase L1-like esterase
VQTSVKAPNFSRRVVPALVCIFAGAVSHSSYCENAGPLKFDFSPLNPAPGITHVLPSTIYTSERGYGFDLGSQVETPDGNSKLAGCRSDRAFFFSVKLPEGNYRVKVTVGDPTRPTVTTVKAESRRLMFERVSTAAGEFVTKAFTVNTRLPRIEPGPGEVRLKPRERGPPLALDWDDKLTLQFSGQCPCIQDIEISKTEDAVTVYLLGDSTVTDQPAEPWNSWGQMLPRFFSPGVAVANHAESGESLRSFSNARRFEKVLSVLKAGDYVCIQFGHNDQKERGDGVGAFTSYAASLRQYVAEVRKRNATPVLVTPVNRRTFDGAGKITNSLGDFPQAVRNVAETERVALIDLNTMSKSFYEALGPEGSKKSFVDNTHHNDYGSYELARCIVEGIRAAKLPLVELLASDVSPFDPAHPDPIVTFTVPPDPQNTAQKPEGN